MRYARLSAQVDGAEYPCRAQGACAPGCTRRRDNAHKIEELEVLYQWHPWFGRVVHVHEVIEQRASGVLRCSPDGDASRRWLELPQWMFDRAACLAIGMAASPRADTAALITLKTCLADASGTGLCEKRVIRSRYRPENRHDIIAPVARARPHSPRPRARVRI